MEWKICKGLMEQSWSGMLNVYPAIRQNLSMRMVLLGSCQQLDTDKEIIWIIYIMMHWSFASSGIDVSLDVDMPSLPPVLLPKALPMVVLKPSHPSFRMVFQHHGFWSSIASAMKLSMTNATWQWAHAHRTHWSQYVAYHSEAASRWNDIWEIQVWCQL